MLFSQFLHSPSPKMGVFGLFNQEKVQNQGGANGNQNARKNIQCKVLTEVNSGISSESGTQKTEKRQNIYTFYIFCAHDNA